MLTREELERYRRQIMIFGEEGQERLKKATVFVAGAGGLGCPVSLYLAAAGIGRIILADRDRAELTNLNRQILHWKKDLGKEKVVSAGEKLRELNPDIEIESLFVDIDEENAYDLVGDADIIVDAMDNFETRYILNRASVRKGVPLVHGAVQGFDGQATTLIPGKTGCLRCLFRNPPPREIFPIIGATAGIIGLIQANEVVKYLVGTGDLLAGRILLWNGLASEMQIIAFDRSSGCEECGK